MAPAFCVGSWRSSPFDCFVTTKQQKPLFNAAPGKTDGPTVNFRPALVSFSACLLENKGPNSRENNGQLRLSLALEALGTAESFPPLSWRFVLCPHFYPLVFLFSSIPCFLVDGSTFYFFLCVCTALCRLSSSRSATVSDWN